MRTQTRTVQGYIDRAGESGCKMVVFGETVVPGYPLWLGRTDAARFNSSLQRDIHSLYLQEAVQIEAGHLDGVCEAARRNRISVVLGVAGRLLDRGDHGEVRCERQNFDPAGHYGRPDVTRLVVDRRRQKLATCTD